MESKFNLQRIANLFKYELVLLKQPLSLSILGFALFIFAICALASTTDPTWVVNEQTLIAIYSLAFTFGVPIITSFSFHRISTKGGAINYLSLPASREEKFLVTFLNTAILFPFGLTLVFIIVEYIIFGIWSVLGGSIGVFLPISLNQGVEGVVYLFITYASVHAFFFFGSSIFRKYAFLKTCVLGFGLITVLFISGVIILALVGYSLSGAAENFSHSFQFDGSSMQGTLQYISNAVSIVIVLGLWTASYFKFKKAQV
ncbi:hypothetical protein [Flammeovirga pacifica]|uniref:Uncharacterized protein n=1 Tax=Flammeovirga pacifica TaxID=915059 RepID=A0A1S1Z544_FLAPC|nr:hypothetical protein [Flammeovirga pacifica]OHX68352.1 hypothetical protein NH26_19360 [Flammeovirga pacifica]